MKGIRKPLDAGRLAENDPHDIETHTVPVEAGAAGVVAGGTFEEAFLVGVHGALGWFHIAARSGFDLDDCQIGSIPADQVEVGTAEGRAIISRHDHYSRGAQEAVREILGLASRGQTPGPESPASQVSHPVGQLVCPRDHLITSNSNSITFPRTTKQR